MIENQSFAHLWYLYVLIGIYLVLPVLQYAVSRMKTTDFKWLLCSLLVVDFLFPLIKSGTGLSIAFEIPFSYCLFYLFLGYYINKWGGIRPQLAIGGILVSALIIIVTNYLGVYPKEISAYNSPVIAVMALCIFSLFRNGIRGGCSEILWKIDRLCFGVYLVHPVFIHFIYRFVKSTPVSFGRYYFSVIGFALLFTVSSFAASMILYKIGIARKYVL